jgi:hypothetical protein
LALSRAKEPSTIIITASADAAVMSEAGSPMGFPAPNPERDRDGLRLLLIVVWIVVLGAAVFAAITFGLP